MLNFEINRFDDYNEVIENIKINPYQYVWFNLPSRSLDIRASKPWRTQSNQRKFTLLIITFQCIFDNMLSLMRRKRIGSSKARFHSEIPLSEESDIYRQFKIVQETLQRANDLENIDTLTYLRPFLFGIRDGYVSISLNYLL